MWTHPLGSMHLPLFSLSPSPTDIYLLNSKGPLTRGAMGSGSSHANPLNLSPRAFFSDFPVSLSSQPRFGSPVASKPFLISLFSVFAAVNKLLLVFLLKKSFIYNFQSCKIAQTQRFRVPHPPQDCARRSFIFHERHPVILICF